MSIENDEVTKRPERNLVMNWIVAGLESEPMILIDELLTLLDFERDNVAEISIKPSAQDNGVVIAVTEVVRGEL